MNTLTKALGSLAMCAAALLGATPARADAGEAPVSAADGPSSAATRTDRGAFHADFEVDPLAYALSGYSLHVGLGFQHVRLDLGGYAMAVPQFVHGNDRFDVSFDGYGAKLQYSPFAEQSGAFVGVDAGLARVLVRAKESDLARRQNQFGVGAHLGWRFELPAGFYATPWIGVGYSFGTEDVTLGGATYESNPWIIFPAVHVGYHFL